MIVAKETRKITPVLSEAVWLITGKEDPSTVGWSWKYVIHFRTQFKWYYAIYFIATYLKIDGESV